MTRLRSVFFTRAWGLVLVMLAIFTLAACNPLNGDSANKDKHPDPGTPPAASNGNPTDDAPSNNDNPGVPDAGDSGTGVTLSPLASALKLNAVAGCDDFKARLTETLYKTFTTQYGVITRGGVVGQPGPMPVPTDSSSASPSAPDGVSGTNNQEVGVDEADLVKTDASGNFYILHNNLLLIERGFPPASLAEAGRLDLTVNGSKMFLDEAAGRLVIFAREALIYLQDSIGGAGMIMPGMPKSEIIFVDVRDITRPTITKRIVVDSYFGESRNIGTRVHMVNRFPTPVPPVLQEAEFQALLQEYDLARSRSMPSDTPDPTVSALEQKIHDAIVAAVQAVAINDLLPHVLVDVNGTQTLEPLLTCADISIPQVTPSNGLQVLSSFDTDGANLQSVAITGDAWQVYVSANYFYLAQNSGSWWWPNSANDLPHTVIHKFAISNAAPVYVATGVVDGWSRDQFSFSEHNAFLRVVTHYSYFDPVALSNDMTNHLFVLEDDLQGNLVVAGAVRDFGKREDVYSSRFVNDKGYVVTFRRIDPLFTFDLSDPHHPVLKGEVAITGFSSYMHPLGDSHLLTIGRSGTATGAANAVQLQIFDVSDLAAPKLSFSLVPVTGDGGYSWSEAMYDHLAFTYYEPQKLLIIPLTYYNGIKASTFNGFALFRVDAQQGITDLGRIDHADLAYQALCKNSDPATTNYQYNCTRGGYVYYANARRSIVMTSGPDTWAYTLSGIGLKANDVDALKEPAAGAIIFP